MTRWLIVHFVALFIAAYPALGSGTAMDVSFDLSGTIGPHGDAPNSICTANLDADPMCEFVVIWWGGEVVAYDNDGTQLWNRMTGWYGAISAGNVDGDPQDEIAVNSADHHLYVYDDDGTVLCVFPLNRLGHDRPRFGDLDGDGCNEIVCSEWDSNTHWASPALVYAFDPRLCVRLWTYELPDDAVTHTADLDGDGAHEVLASTRGDAMPATAVLLDGDGSLMWQIDAQAWRVGFWDIDDNGIPDAVFCCESGCGISAYDGDGTQLMCCSGLGAFWHVDDLDGDGEPEFLTIEGNTLRCVDDDCSEAWAHTFSEKPHSPLPIDADCVGPKEVAVYLLEGDSVFVLSEGKTAWKTRPPVSTRRFKFPERLCDMSGDGRPDVLLGNDTSHIYLYTNTSSCGEIVATLDFDPNTLNLKSKGKYVTCYLELPQSHDPWDIDVSTVLLNGSIPAELSPTSVGDHDRDGIPDRMVKFSRESVISALAADESSRMWLKERGTDSAPILHGEHAEVTVSGDLIGGGSFSGSDIVRVINPGHGSDDIASLTASVTLLDLGARINFRLHSDGHVDLRVFDAGGRLMRTLHNGRLPAGTHTVTWDGRTDSGLEAGRGVYFVRVEHKGTAETQKLLMLR